MEKEYLIKREVVLKVKATTKKEAVKLSNQWNGNGVGRSLTWNYRSKLIGITEK